MKMVFPKRRALIFSLIAILLSLLSSFLLCSSISSFRDSYCKTSVFENTSIDFILPSPSKAQVVELQNKEFVDQTLPYYLTKSQIKHSKNTLNFNVLMFDSLQNIELSPYNQKRCIESGEVKENSAFVDYAFFSKTKCKLQENISIVINGETLFFEIAGFFEENSLFDDGAIAVQYNDMVRNAVMKNRSKDLPYSGMYLSSSSLEECKSFLYSNYKPLGLLKDRDEFESDESYEIYINGFNSANYSNEIVMINQLSTDCYVEANLLNKRGYLTAIINYTILLVFSILPLLIYNANKVENTKILKLIKTGENKKCIFKYYVLPHIISFTISLVTTILVIISNHLSSAFLRLFPCLTLMLIEFFVMLLSFILCILISKAKTNSLFSTNKF